MPDSKTVSVIAPCFNEKDNLPEFIRRVSQVLSEAELDYEIILVNDGSRDETLAVAKELQKTFSHLVVVDLSRNFGHQAAVSAGIDLAQGRAVILIDADLQDPPELIPEMINRWRSGADIVYAQRRHRDGETLFKTTTARMFYRLLGRISRTRIPHDTGDFRLMDRKVADAIRQMPEQHRFIRGMVSWTGFRQEPILYDRAPRYAGKTNYPLRKMMLFSMDAITSFSTVPLRMLTIAGFILIITAFLISLAILTVKLFTDFFIPGFPTVFLLIIFFGGLQMLSLGIVGEYTGRIYEEVKRRPLYIIRNIHRT